MEDDVREKEITTARLFNTDRRADSSASRQTASRFGEENILLILVASLFICFSGCKTVEKEVKSDKLIEIDNANQAKEAPAVEEANKSVISDNASAPIKAGMGTKEPVKENEYLNIKTSDIITTPENNNIQSNTEEKPKKIRKNGIKIVSEKKLLEEGYTEQVKWIPGQDKLIANNKGTIEILDVNTGKREELMKLSGAAEYQELVISNDGKKIIAKDKDNVYLYDINAKKRETILDAHKTSFFDWSPDGKKIVYNYRAKPDIDGTSEIQVIDIESGNITKLTPEGFWLAKWSPQNNKIALENQVTKKGEKFGLWTINTDGSNLSNLFPSGSSSLRQWSRDEKRIYLSTSFNGGLPGLYYINIQDKRLIKITEINQEHLARFSISPDETQIAYAVDKYKYIPRYVALDKENPEDGRDLMESRVYTDSDIYVIDTEGKNEPINLTDTKDRWEDFPQWSSDGNKLLFFEVLPPHQNKAPIPIVVQLDIEK